MVTNLPQAGREPYFLIVKYKILFMKNKLITTFYACLLFMLASWSTQLQAANASLLSIDGCCATFELNFSNWQTGGDWVFYPDYPNTSPVYSGNNNGGSMEITHCYDGPENYRFWFNQDVNGDDVGNDGQADIVDCEQSCCPIPAPGSMEIEEIGLGILEFCEVNPPCPETEHIVRYRELPSGDWKQLTSEWDCFQANIFEDCAEYEFQFAYWAPNCGQSDYGESVFFNTTLGCDDCCAAPSAITVEPHPDFCDHVLVCVDGYESCGIESLTIQFREAGTSDWSNFLAYTSCGYAYTAEFGVTYEIRVRMHTDDCGYTEYSDIVTYTHTVDCEPDCCATPSDITIDQGCEEITVCVNDFEGCDLMRTRVWLKKVGTPGATVLTVVDDNCITFDNLEIGATYRVRVRVRTAECGWSPYSPAITFVLADNCEPECCTPPTMSDISITPTGEACGPHDLCVDGYDDCEGVSTMVFYGPLGSNKKIESGQGTCVGIFLEPGVTYEFFVMIFTADCPNGLVFGPFTYTCNGPGDGGFGDGLQPRLAAPNQETKVNSVHPNPFHSSISINLTAKEDSEIVIQLFDLNGSLIQSKKDQVLSGENLIEFDQLEDLPSGVYFYRLNINGEMITNKIIKQ